MTVMILLTFMSINFNPTTRENDGEDAKHVASYHRNALGPVFVIFYLTPATAHITGLRYPGTHVLGQHSAPRFVHTHTGN